MFVVLSHAERASVASETGSSMLMLTMTDLMTYGSWRVS